MSYLLFDWKIERTCVRQEVDLLRLRPRHHRLLPRSMMMMIFDAVLLEAGVGR